jgi:hypothetical protein
VAHNTPDEDPLQRLAMDQHQHCERAVEFRARSPRDLKKDQPGRFDMTEQIVGRTATFLAQYL